MKDYSNSMYNDGYYEEFNDNMPDINNDITPYSETELYQDTLLNDPKLLEKLNSGKIEICMGKLIEIEKED